jgi:hypothetical protein
MAGENLSTAETEVSVSAATAPVTSAPAQVADPALPTVGNGKNVVLPSATLGKLKAEQRERGAREAIGQLEAKFKAAGFGSIDDAIAAMAAARNGAQNTQHKAPAAKREAAPADTTEQSVGKNDRKQMERIAREREQFAKRYAQEQAQRRKLQRQLEAREAEMALREAAAGKGVRDIDYSLRLLQRELEGKDEQSLATFDEGVFFDGLRKSHPYLFGEITVAATTGTGVGNAPTAPKAGTVAQAQGAAGKSDARSLSSDEFQKLLRARGLNAMGP